MPDHQSVRILGDGPTGSTILTLDKDGLQDNAGRLFDARRYINYPLVAVPTAQYVWRCSVGVWVVESINCLVRVTGGTGATVDVLVCQQVEAVASGVSQLTAVMDVEETAPFQVTGTLIATPTEIYPGDSVGMNGGGTLTGLVGLLTVILKRIK